ncbi:MAG: hypothetical protein IRZ16_08350 [Myxococcaceae bacterium]|nr:hypothetical protein [Myxococcaceae bacterium]
MKRVMAALWAAVLLGACGSVNVGQPCETNDDCAPSLSCYTDRPGGYCTKGCSEPGSDKECPGGTVCAMNGGQSLCSVTCEEQADCRDGYQCNGVPDSTVKVCAPK